MESEEFDFNSSWIEGVWDQNYMNLTYRNNTTEINNFYFYSGLQFAIMWFLLVTIVVGNSTVIVALLLNKHNKSRMNYFIMHLAIADLSVGLISVLSDIVQKTTIVWVAGNFVCKLVKFMAGVVTYSSTYVLVALSIDRCDAISHPMRFTGSWRRARCLIASSWILSCLFCLPMLIFFAEKQVQGTLQCWIDLGPESSPQWKIWITSIFVSLFVMPALTIAACYAIIVATIRSKSKQCIISSSKKKGGLVCTDSDEFNSRRVSSRGLIPKAKIKTIKMTFTIVFAFIICWSPYMVFDLLQVYGYIERTQENIAVATLMQSLAPLNSAANPIIYCIFSKRVFTSLRNLSPYKWICLLCGGFGRPESVVRTSRAHTELLTSSDRGNRKDHMNTNRNNNSSAVRRSNGKQVRVILPPNK